MGKLPKRILVGVPGASRWHPVDPGHGLMLQALESAGVSCELYHSEGPHDIARNKICARGLEAGVDKIVMIDRDIAPPVPGIFELLSHDAEVVAPLMWQWQNGPLPLVFRGVPGGFKIVPSPWKPWQEVDATGTGCMVIDPALLKRMPTPWFAFEIKDKLGTEFIGEDFGFCLRAKTLDAKVVVATKYTAGHRITMDVAEVVKYYSEKASG